MDKILQDLDNLIAAAEQLPRTTFTGSALSELHAARYNLRWQAEWLAEKEKSTPETPTSKTPPSPV